MYWLFGLVLDGDSEVRRYQVMLELSRAGIETRPFFYPMHRLPMYEVAAEHCTNATRIAANGISLPTHFAVREGTVLKIVDSLRVALRRTLSHA